MSEKKILYIVRHGKSSWDDETLADIDRPLKDRGIRDAYSLAAKIKSRGEKPGKIISSPAVRALHTAIIFSQVLGIPEKNIEISGKLLHTSPSEITNLVGKLPPEIDSLMIFGHNPGFTSLANILSNLAIPNIPTCGCVKLVFKTDSWEKIGRKFLADEMVDFPSNP